MQTQSRWQSLVEPKWDEPFLRWLKRFMVWYTLLFSGFIIIAINIITIPIPAGFYLVFLATVAVTLLLIAISVQWFERVLPLSIPVYIIVIHLFIFYTGGAGSPYQPLYFLPVIFASFVFSYIGVAIAVLMVTASHLILEPLLLFDLPFYVASYHFIMIDLPFFTIAALLGIMGAFISDRLKEDNKSLAHLVSQKEAARNALDRELEITRTLYDIDRVILSTTDRRKLLKLCLENLRPLIAADYTSIAILDTEKDELKIVISSYCNSISEEEISIPVGSTIFKWTVLSMASRYHADMEPEAFLPGDDILKTNGIKSLLTVPLISKGSMMIGTLNLGSIRAATFNRDDISLAEGYALHMAVAMDNSSLYERLQSLFMNAVLSFSSAIDAKSRWTQNHSVEVAHYAVAIATRLNLERSFVEELKIAVLLHDIGKIGIRDEILNKPAPLSGEEMQQMMSHPLNGAAILQPIGELKWIIPIIRHHHEWWNGSGYPDGLSGNMIPLGARILNVADAFESMVTDRPYRKGLTTEKAKEELLRAAGTQFDPNIVSAFLALLESGKLRI